MAGLTDSSFRSKPLRPQLFGELLISPRILKEERHYERRGFSDNFEVEGVVDTGWRTLSADFDAYGPARHILQLYSALVRAHERDPRIRLGIHEGVEAEGIKLSVVLSVTYQQGDFPVPGLLEALTAPSQALPPLKL